jgi:LysM repeat protein
VRIPALLASVVCLSLPLLAQIPDPGASQDEEAAREKLLKAADQLDLMENNAEANRTAIEGMKAEVAKVDSDNAALRQQLASLQDAFQKSEDARARERQVLLDEVSKLVASRSSEPSHPMKKKVIAEDEASLAPPPEAPTAGPTHPAESAGASDSTPAATTADAPADAPVDSPPPPKPKPRKGYSYTVEDGQTLTMICAAYRAEGVPVTVSAVRKANGLTEKSVLKPGQKLFIPKPEN